MVEMKQSVKSINTEPFKVSYKMNLMPAEAA
jgi:hypothetical protein